jgi:cell division protein FtsI/penicillin-binding protein 2
MSSIGWKPPEERDPEIQQIPGVGGRLLFMRVVVVLILSLLVYRVYWLAADQGADLATRAERTSSPR